MGGRSSEETGRVLRGVCEWGRRDGRGLEGGGGMGGEGEWGKESKHPEMSEGAKVGEG